MSIILVLSKPCQENLRFGDLAKAAARVAIGITMNNPKSRTRRISTISTRKTPKGKLQKRNL